MAVKNFKYYAAIFKNRKTGAQMKRFLRIAVMLCVFILTILSANSVFATEPYIDIWDGSIADSFEGGSGAKDDPYLIKTGAQLAFLAKQVNMGNDYSGMYFALINDIDLVDRKWMPIGYSKDNSISFCGNFNGSNHAVRHLKLMCESNGSYGLFGQIKNASVEKLFLINTNINGSAMGIGAVAGSMIRSTVSQCCHMGNISGDQSVGGIVGSASKSKINDCYNAGIISADYGIVGGIAGQINMSSQIKNCYNSGSIKANRGPSGGIAGIVTFGDEIWNKSYVTTCFNSGDIYGKGSVGAIIGWRASYSSAQRCYFAPNQYYGIGGIDNNESGSNSGTTSTNKKNFYSQQWISNNLDWDFESTWVMPTDGYYRFPILVGDNPMKNIKLEIRKIEITKDECYSIIVTDKNNNLIADPTVDYNGTVFPVDEQGRAILNNVQSGGILTVGAENYVKQKKENYQFKEANVDIIRLRQDPYELISAIMTYNSDERDITSERAVINLIYKDTTFKIRCAVSESATSEVKKYELVQENNVIASSEDGKFEVKVGEFKKDASVYVQTIDVNGKVLASTPLMLTVKKAEPKIPDKIELGKSIKFTVPSDAPLFGGMEMDLKIPLLPITMDVREDSIEIGINYDIAKYNKTFSAGGKAPKINWKGGMSKTPDLAKRINETAEKLGSKRMKSRISKGISVEWTVFGSAEMPYDASSMKGKIYIVIELKCSIEKQAWNIPPIVVELSFNGKASADGEFEWSVQNGLTAQIPLKVNAALGLYGGIGGASYASVGIYGEGGTEVKLLLAGSEADSGLESWKLYGSVGMKAMLLRKELGRLKLLNGDKYLYRRDTGNLKNTPAKPYLSPGRWLAELDPDLVYKTVAQKQQSAWLGTTALDVKTTVIQSDLTTAAESDKTTDEIAMIPEAEMPPQSPEPTPDIKPEPALGQDTSTMPIQEAEPIFTPDSASEPALNIEQSPTNGDDEEQIPEAMQDVNVPFKTMNSIPTSLNIVNNILPVSYTSQAFSNLPSSPEALQINSDTEIEPILVDCGDTLMMLYCDADTDRPLADCSKLVFSLLDPATGQWTEPTAVWDDGTADYAPDACAGENGVYIVWQNAKDFINEEDTLNEIGAKIEISVAHFDSKNNSITVETVTENDIYEAMPNICLTTEDIPILAWVENGNNNILGSEATEQEPNRLCCIQKSASGWGEKVLLAEYTDIAFSMDVGFTADGIEACINLDRDKDFNTAEDRTVLVARMDGAATYASGGEACYLGGKLLYMESAQDGETKLYYGGAAMNMGALPTAGYTAALDTDGDIMFCWSMVQEGKGCLYTMEYDVVEKAWTEPIELTEAEMAHYHEKAACAYVEGKPIFAYVDRIVTDSLALDSTAGLYWFAMPERKTYTINSVLFDETEVRPGCTLPLTVEITNTGTLSIDKLHAELIDAEGEIVVNQDLTFALLSGSTGTAEIMLVLPEEAQYMQYTLKLDDDKEVKIDIGRAMLITGSQVYKTENEQTVIVYVKNIGLAAASGIFSIIDQENGAVVASDKFTNLCYGGVFSLQFSISKIQEDLNLMLIVESDAEQVSNDENLSYVKLYYDKVFILGDINQDGSIDMQDLILLNKHIVGAITLPSEQAVLADVNKDGILTLRDSLELCHHMVS